MVPADSLLWANLFWEAGWLRSCFMLSEVCFGKLQGKFYLDVGMGVEVLG